MCDKTALLTGLLLHIYCLLGINWFLMPRSYDKVVLALVCKWLWKHVRHFQITLEHACRVIVIGASVVFFKNPMSLQSKVCTGIALAGVLAYSQVKRLRGQAKKAAAA
jgi:hypothetical protein